MVYLLNSGSEANDLAILLSRLYTGNNEILSLKNCYHGMSYQTMGLTSVGSYKYSVTPPAGFHSVSKISTYLSIYSADKPI